ncbi:MAG TPA: hypothetical protein VMY37_22510 [Thermoguttaceae bacterium]|nr:hypothetical protein [Thermoguttaceae bacterium]
MGADAGNACLGAVAVNASFAPFASPFPCEFWALGGFSDSSGVDGEGDGVRNLKIAVARAEISGGSEGLEALALGSL